MTTAERLTAVAENVKKVYEAGKAAGGLPDGDMSDPDYVYAVTRPKDWLPMPRPGDNEMYLLGQILPESKGYFYVLLTFSGACTIEVGNLVNGAFVTKASYTPTSGAPFSCVIEYSDYGDDLSDGTRQYMVRISGTTVRSVRFNYIELNVPVPIIVDAVCGIALDRFTCANYNNTHETINSLRYLRFVGKGRPGWINGSAFVGGCRSLLSIDCEAKNISDHASYSCYMCESLLAVSPNLFAAVKNGMPYAFLSTSLSDVRTGVEITNASHMFQDSMLKTYTPETVNLGKATNLNSAFRQCYLLCSATGVNISSATDVTNMFDICESLNRLTFAGETTPGGWTLDLTSTRLDHDALVEMINSIPSATAAATITITGLPGASELTDAEIAVATAKNWTITR